MVMTNEDKQELIKEVKKYQSLGWTMTDGVSRILHFSPWYKRRTAIKYWKIFAVQDTG